MAEVSDPDVSVKTDLQLESDQSSTCDNPLTQRSVSQNSTENNISNTSISLDSESSCIHSSDIGQTKGKLLVGVQGSSYMSEDTPTTDVHNILSVLDIDDKCRDKNASEGDSVGSYDTHSIDTLKEAGSREDISNDLNGTLSRQTNLTSQQEQTSKAAIADIDGDVVSSRPDSLSLARSKVPKFERIRSGSEAQLKLSKSDVSSQADDRLRSQSDIIEIGISRRYQEDIVSDSCLSKSLPHGTIVRKGEMIEFVAEDLQEKIRRSSPISKTDSSSYSSRRSSLRSVSSTTSASTSMATSSGFSRSPSSLFQQSPDDLPPIDPQALFDLENQALLVADSIDLMMGNLKSNLHKMSSITIGCLDAYRHSVDLTCESVDGSIKSMYALMAKCEELSTNMSPVYKLAEKIKEIKRLLDIFESQLMDKT